MTHACRQCRGMISGEMSLLKKTCSGGWRPEVYGGILRSVQSNPAPPGRAPSFAMKLISNPAMWRDQGFLVYPAGPSWRFEETRKSVKVRPSTTSGAVQRQDRGTFDPLNIPRKSVGAQGLMATRRAQHPRAESRWRILGGDVEGSVQSVGSCRVLRGGQC